MKMWINNLLCATYHNFSHSIGKVGNTTDYQCKHSENQIDYLNPIWPLTLYLLNHWSSDQFLSDVFILYLSTFSEEKFQQIVLDMMNLVYVTTLRITSYMHFWWPNSFYSDPGHYAPLPPSVNYRSSDSPWVIGLSISISLDKLWHRNMILYSIYIVLHRCYQVLVKLIFV